MEATARFRRASERGSVLLAGALFSVVLFLFTGLIVDAGMLECQRQRAQTAADQAALAAGFELRNHTGRAVAAGLLAAQVNGFSSRHEGDTVAVYQPPRAGREAGDRQRVEAVVTRRVPVTILTVLGAHSLTVAARATAVLGPPDHGIAPLALEE